MNVEKFLEEQLKTFSPNDQKDLMEYIEACQELGNDLDVIIRKDEIEGLFYVHFNSWDEFWLESGTMDELLEYVKKYEMYLLEFK